MHPLLNTIARHLVGEGKWAAVDENYGTVYFGAGYWRGFVFAFDSDEPLEACDIREGSQSCKGIRLINPGKSDGEVRLAEFAVAALAGLEISDPPQVIF